MGINDRIKEIRRDAGLSQQEFGEAINISGNSVYRIESGSRGVSERTMKDICSEFNVNLEWLQTGAGEKYKETNESIIAVLKAEYKLDDIDISIIDSYLNLSPLERQVYKDFIDKIKGSAV